MKTLEIGKNYGEVFGLNPADGNKLIYLGGTLFEGYKGEKTMQVNSQKTLDQVLAYINRPSVSMGSVR